MTLNDYTVRKRRTLFAVLMAALLVPTLVVSLLQGVGSAADATVIAGSDRGSVVGREVAVRNTVERRRVSSTTKSVPESSTTTEVVTTTAEAPTTVAPATTVAPSTTTAAPAQVRAAAPTPAPTTAAPAPAPAPPVAAPAAPAAPVSADLQAFLACIRKRESGGNYQIVSSNGLYHGAYQFLQSSWDSTARHAGRGDLVGIPPERVSPADQDAMAIALFQWQGARPWGGACV